MKILCVIPARLHSTRLPRKPLLSIQGKPMIQWTYENALRCQKLSDLVVATDDEEIAEIIWRMGGKAKLTDKDLPNGSERVAAVAMDYPDHELVINLQGDEPFIKPAMLEELVSPWFSGENPNMTTLAYPLENNKYHDPGAVKVITDIHHHALYFSRSAIPWYRSQTAAPVYHHMGLYAFRRDFLMTFKELKPTPLEQVELLEQLRVLEHGYKIRVCYTKERTLEINTPEEYEQAQLFDYTQGD